MSDPMLCKCGKPSTGAIMGKEVYMVFCNVCSPMNKYVAEMVYKQPDGTKVEIEYGRGW